MACTVSTVSAYIATALVCSSCAGTGAATWARSQSGTSVARHASPKTRSTLARASRKPPGGCISVMRLGRIVVKDQLLLITSPNRLEEFPHIGIAGYGKEDGVFYQAA